MTPFSQFTPDDPFFSAFQSKSSGQINFANHNKNVGIKFKFPGLCVIWPPMTSHFLISPPKTPFFIEKLSLIAPWFDALVCTPISLIYSSSSPPHPGHRETKTKWNALGKSWILPQTEVLVLQRLEGGDPKLTNPKPNPNPTLTLNLTLTPNPKIILTFTLNPNPKFTNPPSSRCITLCTRIDTKNVEILKRKEEKH